MKGNIVVRKSDDRGYFDHDWLKTYHTFSFGDYFDREHMGYRQLRVINEDFVAPGEGFGMHPHRDMEIITYVISGALRHEDSLGNSSVIRPGEVQRMTAGKGIIHSEFNDSSAQGGADAVPVHLLQIWILPKEKGLDPSYEQKNFPDQLRENKLCLVASEQGREGSVLIHQAVDVYASKLQAEKEISFFAQPNLSGVWVQVISGKLSIEEHTLDAGDGVSIESFEKIMIRALAQGAQSEFLLFAFFK